MLELVAETRGEPTRVEERGALEGLKLGRPCGVFVVARPRTSFLHTLGLAWR